MGWSAWDWSSAFTRGWAAWALVFIVLEVAAVTLGYRYTLTAHLRPVFITWPVLWFIGFGLWLWLGIHMLAPALEVWFIERVKG